MQKYIFANSTVGAEPEKTRRLYASLPPYFLKCTCPSCQNYFAAINPYKEIISHSLTDYLGIDINKPKDITLLYAEGETVVYRVRYIACGRRLSAPPLYNKTENELGVIRTQNPAALYRINGCLAASFQNGQKGEYLVRITAVLPWVMQTLNCFYAGAPVEKPLLRRGKRICSAAKQIVKTKKGEQSARFSKEDN